MLKNIPPKKASSKNDSQIGFKKRRDFRVGASWGTLGDPNRFLASKVGPQRPKVLPMIEKRNKHDTKESPESEKELQKSSLFGAWLGGLREALTINKRIVFGVAYGAKVFGGGAWVFSIWWCVGTC